MAATSWLYKDKTFVQFCINYTFSEKTKQNRRVKRALIIFVRRNDKYIWALTNYLIPIHHQESTPSPAPLKNVDPKHNSSMWCIMKLLYGISSVHLWKNLVTLTYIRIISEKKKDHQWVIWTKPLGRLENYPTFWLWRTRLIVIFYRFYECVHWSKSDKKHQWFSNRDYSLPLVF